MKNALYAISIIVIALGSVLLVARTPNPVHVDHHVYDIQVPQERPLTLRPRTIVSWGSRDSIEGGLEDIYHSTPACPKCMPDMVPMRTTYLQDEGWTPCPYCQAEREPGEYAK